ncbi:MAG: hypothetical protein ACJ72D_06335 [Marmoricola sp.]
MGDHVSRAASDSVSVFARCAGILKGFGAELIRVAAGERGPVIPGFLPGPSHAPIEEGAHEESPEEVPEHLQADRRYRPPVVRDDARADEV